MHLDGVLYRVMLAASVVAFLLGVIALAAPTLTPVDLGLVAFVVFSVATLAGLGWLALDPRRLAG